MDNKGQKLVAFIMQEHSLSRSEARRWLREYFDASRRAQRLTGDKGYKVVTQENPHRRLFKPAELESNEILGNTPDERETMRLRRINKQCARCGINVDLQTPNCPTCKSRHWNRQNARSHDTITTN